MVECHMLISCITKLDIYLFVAKSLVFKIFHISTKGRGKAHDSTWCAVIHCPSMLQVVC